jgi:hypothetical protein
MLVEKKEIKICDIILGLEFWIQINLNEFIILIVNVTGKVS